MKRLFLFFLVFISWVGAHEAHAGFLVGSLENGLRYYIRENRHAEKRASLRLAVKMGSIYEQEEERGIAHFVEHMVFRGSRHFKDGEIFDYLESIGASAGADVNAFTTFDSTEYFMDIPLEKEGVLEKGMAILSDIAFWADFPDDLVEREREVILDEYRRKGLKPSYRCMLEDLNALVAGSSYENRDPIGTAQVIKTYPAEKMRAFYQRWYRPDRMAVVVIGDFDAHQIERMIAEKFSQKEAPQEVLPKANRKITLPSETIKKVHYDEEFKRTSFTSRYITQDKKKASWERFLESIVTRLMEQRLDKLDRRYPDLFLQTFYFDFEFMPSYNSCGVDVRCFEEKVAEAYHVLQREIDQIFECGFTEEEFCNVVQRMAVGYKSALMRLDQTGNNDYASLAIDHFKFQERIKNQERVIKKRLAYLEKVSLRDVCEVLQTHPFLKSPTLLSLSTNNADVAAQGWDFGKPADLPSPVLAEQERKERWSAQPEFERGSVEQASYDSSHGLHHWVLSNGVRMYLKPTRLENDRVIIFAFAQGGQSAFPPAMHSSAAFSIDYCLESGFGGLTGEGLDDFMTSEKISFDLCLSFSTRSMLLTSTKEKSFRLFETLHHFFSKKNYDMCVWNRLVNQTKEIMKCRRNDPDIAFEEFVDAVNTQDFYLFSDLKVEEAREEEARTCFERCFSHPAEFVFVVVGDFSIQEAKEFSEVYLASLPSFPIAPLVQPKFPRLFPKGEHILEFRKGKMEHGETWVTFPCDFEAYGQVFSTPIAARAAVTILERRLTEVLRRELGKTYGVSVELYQPFAPDLQNSLLFVHFTSLPENIEEMGKKIREEMARLKQEHPTEKEVETAKEIMLNPLKQSKKTNPYWISVLFTVETQGRSLKSALNAEERIKKLSPHTIQQAALLLWNTQDFTQISHLSGQKLDLKIDPP